MKNTQYYIKSPFSFKPKLNMHSNVLLRAFITFFILIPKTYYIIPDESSPFLVLLHVYKKKKS